MKADNFKNFSNKEILDKAQEFESIKEFRVKAHYYYLEAKIRSLLPVATRHCGHNYISLAATQNMSS